MKQDEWINKIRIFYDRSNERVLVILLLLVGFFILKDYLLLKKLYIFIDIGSDSYNRAYPYLVSVSDYIRSEGVPFWSFFQGMGQNIFPGEINNPFNLILYILGRKYLPYGIAYVELLKMILGGIIFYYYLKILSFSNYTRIIGSILFAFSGYMVLGSGWYGHSTFVVFGSFYLFAFEKIFLENKWAYFPVAVAMICCKSPFYLYILSVFLLLYSVFRLCDEGGYDFKKISFLYLKLMGLGLLGIAMVTPFVLNDLLRMMESPRIGGDAGYSNQLIGNSVFSFGNYKHNVTAILRLFSNDILGVGSNYKGWYNYLEAPNFYCGLSTLLLFPQIFMLLEKRRKIISSAFALIWVFIVVFPFFRYALYLFTGDYYKGGLSFIVMVVLLLYGLQALNFIERNRKIHVKLLLSTLIIMLGLLYFPYFPEEKGYVVKETRLMITAFLMIYAGLIYSFGKGRGSWASRFIFLTVICIEASMFSFITCHSRSVLTADDLDQPIGYNDGTAEIMAYIKQKDNGFFRINKDYSSGRAMHASLNDALIQKYYGTSSYYQFNQKYYIRFLAGTGTIDSDDEAMTRWAPGLSSRPLLQTLVSVKYQLNKKEETDFEKTSYRPLVKYNDVVVFENRFFLTLGFTYDRYFPYSQFDELSTLEKDMLLLKAFVAEDFEEAFNDFDIFNVDNLNDRYTLGEYEDDVNRLSQETMILKSHSQNNIKGTIEVGGRKLLFFSIPYDKGWSIYVDEIGIEPRLVNIGFMGVILEKGAHSIELKYTPPFLFAGTIIMIVSILFYVFLIILSQLKQVSIGH